MKDWNIEKTEKYTRDYRWYEKKHIDELETVMLNVRRYFIILQTSGNPWDNLGFTHKESMGIIAIDQKGGYSGKTLRQTRLYIYPDAKNKDLHFLAIGDKRSQPKDIKYCEKKVKKIREAKQNG